MTLPTSDKDNPSCLRRYAKNSPMSMQVDYIPKLKMEEGEI